VGDEIDFIKTRGNIHVKTSATVAADHIFFIPKLKLGKIISDPLPLPKPKVEENLLTNLITELIKNNKIDSFIKKEKEDLTLSPQTKRKAVEDIEIDDDCKNKIIEENISINVLINLLL
jgi:hypothetical protein